MMLYVAGRHPPSPPAEPLASGPATVLPPTRLPFPRSARQVRQPVELPAPVAHSGIPAKTVKAACCEALGIPDWHLTTPKRDKAIARPRQVVMAMVRRWCGLSLPQIGRIHGRRDHTTVMHALQATKARIDAADPVAAEQFEACDAAVKAIAPDGVEPLAVWWKGPRSDA